MTQEEVTCSKGTRLGHLRQPRVPTAVRFYWSKVEA